MGWSFVGGGVAGYCRVIVGRWVRYWRGRGGGGGALGVVLLRA